MFDYLNQSVVWRRADGTTNDYGEPNYADSTIPARVENRLRRVRDKHGVEVTSNSTIFTTSPVQIGDQIDGRVVIESLTMQGLDEIMGYEVLV